MHQVRTKTPARANKPVESQRKAHHQKGDAEHQPVWTHSQPVLPLVPLQAKLTINQPGDVYEQEADRVADQVMCMAEPAVQHCACGGNADSIGECEACRQERLSLQRKAAAPTETGMAVPPIVHDVLRSPGQPLDDATRAVMESRFGYDFSNVRIHTDVQAAESARAVNARAYTVGRDVVFGTGHYAPRTGAGKRLMAHELTHVVQQSQISPNTFEQNTYFGQEAGCVTARSLPRHTTVSVKHENIGIARQPTPPSPLTIPTEGVDMPWVGSGRPSSELGYLRDSEFFWSRFSTMYGNQLSPANQTRIANGQAPVVDAHWVQFHPQHAGYMGDILEHHHVGQGSRAVPLPEHLHDAYTVFHPQRRVVGTPQGGTRPLPPQPTRAQTQAEIDRHVRQGRIRGPGVSPAIPPQAPAVPPSSELAAVPAPKPAPVLPKAQPPTTQAPPVKVPATKSFSAGLKDLRGRIGSGIKGVAPIGINILSSLLAGWIKQKRENKQIAEDLQLLEPEIQERLSALTPSMAAYFDEVPGAKLYANISVTLQYSNSLIPGESDPEIETTYMGIEKGSLTVDFSPDNIQKYELIEWKLVGWFIFSEKWNYYRATFSIPLQVQLQSAK